MNKWTLFFVLTAGLGALPASAAERCDRYNDYSAETLSRAGFSDQLMDSKVTLSGRLYSRLLKKTDDGFIYGFQLEDPKLEQDGKQFPPPPYYGYPFALQFDAEGAIAASWHLGDLAPENEATLIGLVRMLQFTPSAHDPARFEVTERDGVGEVTVDYEVLADGWHEKQRTDYLRLLDYRGHETDDSVADILRDKTRLLPGDCWLDEAESDYLMKLRMPGMANYQQLVHQQTMLDTFGKTSQSARDAVILYGLSSNPALWNVDADASEGLLQKAQIEKTLTAEEIAELTKEFNELALSEDASIQDISAWFAEHPQATSAAVTSVLDNPAVEEQFSADLFAALGSLRTRKGAEVLHQTLVSTDHSYANRMRAIIALSDSPSSVDPKVIDTLWGQWEGFESTNAEQRSLAASSLLSMGSIARDNPRSATGQRITNNLVEALEGSSDLQAQAQLVSALGNTRNPAAADSLLPLVESPSRGVVQSTIRALGRIGRPEDAVSVLADFDDFDSSNQHAILDSFNPKHVDEKTITRVVRSVEQSNDRQLRIKAAQFAAKSGSRSSEGVEALRSLGRSATSKDELRAIIQGMAAAK